MNRSSEVIDAIASLNPVLSEEVDRKVDHVESLKEIMAQLPERPMPRRHVGARSVLLAIALIALLVVPALAASGRLDSLFGFSNPGTTIDRGSLSLRSVSALDRVGVNDRTIKLLGKRHELAFYATRSKTGGLCIGVGPSAAGATSFDQLRCQIAEGQTFPSSELPVNDLSVFHGQIGNPNIYLERLAGVAADGVAKVGFISRDGLRYITPVVDNIYAERAPPQEPVSALIALDREGRVVWRNGGFRPMPSG